MQCPQNLTLGHLHVKINGRSSTTPVAKLWKANLRRGARKLQFMFPPHNDRKRHREIHTNTDMRQPNGHWCVLNRDGEWLCELFTTQI